MRHIYQINIFHVIRFGITFVIMHCSIVFAGGHINMPANNDWSNTFNYEPNKNQYCIGQNNKPYFHSQKSNPNIGWCSACAVGTSLGCPPSNASSILYKCLTDSNCFYTNSCYYYDCFGQPGQKICLDDYGGAPKSSNPALQIEVSGGASRGNSFRCAPCNEQPSRCAQGCDFSTGLCRANNTPSFTVTPGPISASLSIGNSNFTSGDKLGTLTVSDSDASDTVTLSVKSVSSSGFSLPVSLSDSDLLGMINLNPTTVISSGQTSGTFDWSFQPGSEKFDFLKQNDQLVLRYTIEAKDSRNATSQTTLTVILDGIECTSNSDCKNKSQPFCSSIAGCVQCMKDSDCIRISEAKPYCSNDYICYNDAPAFSGKKNHTLDLNKTNEISGKLTVTDNNTSDTVFLFVKDINDVNNNSGMSTAELRKMLQPSIVPQLIDRQQTSGDYNWSLKITNDKQISSEVKLSYTLEARDKNNAVSSYQLNFTIIPRDPAANTNSDFTDSPPLATPSTGPVNTTDNIMDDSNTEDSESSFTTEESTDATSSSTSPTPSSGNVLLECNNKVHPNSDLKLSTGDTVEGCITRKGGQTISCTVKDPGTFGGKMSVECSEAIKKCVSEQTLTNKRGKERTTTRASVAGCKVVK